MQGESGAWFTLTSDIAVDMVLMYDRHVHEDFPRRDGRPPLIVCYNGGTCC